MNIKNILLFLFLLFSFLGFSANETKIKGVFPNAKGKYIRALTYNDLVTNVKVEIAKTRITKDNSFELKLNLKNVTYVFLQMEFFRIQMYIEPGKEYTILFDTLDVNNTKFYPVNIVGYLSPHYTIKDAGPRELNNELETLSAVYGEFIDQNYLSLTRGIKVDSLVNVIKPRLDSLSALSPNVFIKNAIQLQKYRLDMMTHKTSKPKLLKEVFTSKNLKYDDKPTMEYFNSLYSDVLNFPSKNYKKAELDSAFSKEMSYQAISKVIKKDEMFADSAIREHIVLCNISQLYYSNRYSNECLDKILLEIASKSKNVEHKKIANNLFAKLHQMQIGQKLPEYRLITLSGDTLTNATLEGKYTYLLFWSTSNSESIAELELIKQKTYDEFEDVINFVAISLDADASTVENYVKNKGFKWYIVHFNHDFKLLDNLKIEMIPYAILIDKTGKIERTEVFLPSQGFSPYFLKLLNDKKGNLRLR